MPFFSVIIPCYNSSEVIHNALRSLESQTFGDFEAIFVDDASTDNTSELLEEWAKSVGFKVTLLHNESNCGPGISRNRGIAISKGDYLLFMDSDDWYENDYMEVMHTEVTEKESDTAICGFFRAYNGKKHRMAAWAPPEYRQDKSFILASATDSLCLMAIRRKVMQNIKLPPLYNAEDVAIIPVIISYSEKVSYTPTPLYNYLYATGSLSNNSEKINPGSFLESYKFITENVSAPDLYIPEMEYIGVRTVLYGFVFNAVRSKMKWGEIREQIDHFTSTHKNWRKNKYVANLPFRKRAFLYAVDRKIFPALKLYVWMHRIALTRG